MGRLLRWLRRTGFRRGLGGEGWHWFLLALAAFTFERVLRDKPETVTKVRMQAGDRFVIRAVERKSRGKRRVAPASAAKAAFDEDPGTSSSNGRLSAAALRSMAPNGGSQV